MYILSCLFAPLIPVAAQAEAGAYACILEKNVYFYATKDLSRGVFTLPQTYYVKVLEINDDFCKIEYLYDDEYTQKLTGYAKTELLTFVDYVPKRPYLYRLFELSYTIDGGGHNGDGFLDEIKVQCAYYGDYEIGSTTYCYILRNGDFGYVPKPATLDIEENTEYAEWLKSQEEATPPASAPVESEAASPAQIAILIALCLLVPILSALILRSSKHPPYDPDGQ